MGTKSFLRIGTLLIICVPSLACNNGRLKTYPVQGQVVFADGSPVKVGTVETKSVEHGVQSTGSIGLDGRFTLTTYKPNDGAVEGQHRCVVIQFIPIEDIPNYRPSIMGVVNRKHSMYSTSELNFTVKPGEDSSVKLVVQGADPILRATDDHGHDPVPDEPKDAKGQ
jgi:ribosomal protein S12